MCLYSLNLTRSYARRLSGRRPSSVVYHFGGSGPYSRVLLPRRLSSLGIEDIPLSCSLPSPSSVSPSLSKENRQISERDDLGLPLYQGVRRSVWGPETSRERIGDWDVPETAWAPLCVAEKRATRPNGEWRYSTRRHVLEPERAEAV